MHNAMVMTRLVIPHSCRKCRQFERTIQGSERRKERQGSGGNLAIGISKSDLERMKGSESPGALRYVLCGEPNGASEPET